VILFARASVATIAMAAIMPAIMKCVIVELRRTKVLSTRAFVMVLICSSFLVASETFVERYALDISTLHANYE
jgi:hypothetical protein